MKIFESRLKKWRNYFGIVVPNEFVNREKINTNDRIKILILKDSRKAFRKTFGIGKGKINKSAQEFKDETRNDIY